MKNFASLAIIAAVALGVVPSQVEAKGCIRGAVAGAVAGHYAGHHAVLGAMGGCAVGRSYYKHKAAKAAVAAQPAPAHAH